MRLNPKRIQQVKLRKFKSIKDNEGGVSEGFSPSFTLVDVELYPATNKRQSQLYGLRVNEIMNVLYQGEDVIDINDGLCIYTQENPDFRVISKQRYTLHTELEIERI